MQITMDTSAQQLLHAKWTAHTVIINLCKPSTQKIHMVSSPDKSWKCTVTLHTKKCSKNTANVLCSTYSFSLGVRILNMKYQLVLLGMWKGTKVWIKALSLNKVYRNLLCQAMLPATPTTSSWHGRKCRLECQHPRDGRHCVLFRASLQCAFSLKGGRQWQPFVGYERIESRQRPSH